MAARWLTRHSFSIIETFHAILYISGALTFEALRKLYYASHREISYHTAASALRRAIERGTILPVHRGNTTYYTISPETAQRFSTIDDVLNQQRSKRWWVVIFDVPESQAPKRNMLRDHLKRLGFSALQKSVWVSTRNISKADFALIDELKLKRYVLAFQTDTIGGWLTDREVKEIFGVRDLNRGYRDLVDELTAALQRWRGQQFEDDEHRRLSIKALRQITLAKYAKLLRRDPLLPDRLLPKPWYRKRLIVLLNTMNRL